MHRTPPLTFDPAAAQAWLRQPSDTHAGLTRAESLGVDDELTGRGGEGILDTVDDVLTARPDGLHRRDDITAVDLWPIPDGDIGDQGALIAYLSGDAEGLRDVVDVSYGEDYRTVLGWIEAAA